MLHAVHSSSESYLQVCSLLKDQFNLVALDFPGHGLSEHLNPQQYSWYYSFEGFTSVLIEFVNRLNLKNFFIVGDSAGGNCAVRGLPSLKMLEGLVLIGSVQAENMEKVLGLHHSPGPINFLFQKEFSQQECEEVAAAYVDPYKNDRKNFKKMISDIQHTDPNFREQFAHYLVTQSWVDELELLQKYPLPFIYILGRDDGFLNSVYYKKVLLERGLKESQLHLLDQARHIPYLDDPDLCTKLILDFIENQSC